MKGRLLVAGLVVLLAGCAGPQYKMVKPGISDQEVYQDDAHCQNQAALIQVADWEYRGSIAEGANIKIKQQKAYQNCMISRGYSAVRMN